jgi:hypothetical protein
MRRSRFSEQQIIGILKEHEAGQSSTRGHHRQALLNRLTPAARR